MSFSRVWARVAPQGRGLHYSLLVVPIVALLWHAVPAPSDGQTLEFVVAPEREEEMDAQVFEEWMWLARAVYSETKRPEEQTLIAWVIRNRVESAFRGRDSYKRVVLDPYQFSAFNPGSSRRRQYSSLDTSYVASTWWQALAISRYVMFADTIDRPFPIETRHFYSERSMPGAVHPDSGASHPSWVSEGTLVALVERGIDQRRFRFYRGVL